jgi:hypothetical protein
MSDNKTYNIITNTQKDTLKTIVGTAIDNIFKSLVSDQKVILKEYLYKTCILVSVYFYNENFIDQLQMNNYQDIYSIMVLLLPYFELTKESISKIERLEEIIFNKDEKGVKLLANFIIDHAHKEKNIISYFENIFLILSKSFKKITNKLMPNWLNIFPYSMSDYANSSINKNFIDLYKNSTFTLENDVMLDIDNTQVFTNRFELGYDTLYGTIHNFLFKDIVKIKWMIYDIFLSVKISGGAKDQVCPLIVFLCNLLDINDIVNNPWIKDKENDNNDNKDKVIIAQQDKLKEKWNKNILSNEQNIKYIASMILFYLRWERDEDNLNKLNIPKECIGIIKSNIDEIDIDKDNQQDKVDEFIDKSENDAKILDCIKKILPNIDFGRIYTYIYECVQQFRYTWYGFSCMDDDKNILPIDTFIQQFSAKTKVLEIDKDSSRYKDPNVTYITPKMIYNYFKSLLHYPIGENYEIPNNSWSWDNMHKNYQELFIQRINNRDVRSSGWFSIPNNLKNLFPFLNAVSIKSYMSELRKELVENRESTLFIRIIMETLVYNGVLTYFKYNPSLTNKSKIPNKNTNFSEWDAYMKSNVTMKGYVDSYHFLDNKKYNKHSEINKIIESLWFTNFGGDWIAQIQQFHHFIVQRIWFVTGATGAGKSTVFPFMILYALKILSFNNNGKVFCTQPRIQPTKDNATRMSEQLGFPFTKGKSNGKDDFLPSQINYLQYKTSEDDITDELYHPCLRLYTDGLLYKIITNSYIFKNSREATKDNKDIFSKTNLFDVILIDEAHEHNTNMDMLLTLCKFAIYINNQVSLGIISATMDEDEKTYRKYYQYIDDNWKFPLELDYINWSKEPRGRTDRNFIDRRLHMSVPFGGTNFIVDEITNLQKGKEVDTEDPAHILNILNEILTSTKSGDILIFQSGSGNIDKLVEQANEHIPANVLAIPFHSQINKTILDRIKAIDKKDIRKLFRYPKDKDYDVEDMDKVPEQDKVPEGFYTRFVLIATNIAEASITINSLEYIIETGKRKIQMYDVETNQSKFEIRDIAKSNQKQRKGRVGRVKPGKVFYTYDRTTLADRVIFNITIEDISSSIIELLSEQLNEPKLFTNTTDPYNTTLLSTIPNFLQEQYVFRDDSDVFVLYNRNKDKLFNTIIYPYSDGKYDYKMLLDPDGKFYIVHPNELDFTRNSDLQITKKPEKFTNKVESIFNHNIKLGILDSEYKLTKYGINITNLAQLLLINLELTSGICNLESYEYSIDRDKNFVYKNYILFIVFKLSEYRNINLGKTLVNSDFLGKADMIPDRYYNYKILDFIENKIKIKNNDFVNLDKLIEEEVGNLLNLIVVSNIANTNDEEKIKSVTFDIKSILLNFYKIKVRLQILNKQIEKHKKNKEEKEDKYKKIKAIKQIILNPLDRKSYEKISKIKSLSVYEQICYFITNTLINNIVIKVPYTKFYIGYIRRNVNNLYQLKSNKDLESVVEQVVINSNKKRKFKLKYYTNVPNNYRDNIIFFMNSDDTNNIQNIMWIPQSIMNILMENSVNKIQIYDKIDKKQIIDTSSKDIFYDISKKIDYIINYIKNSNK